MVVISVVNEKGGVGKDLCSEEICYSFIRTGIRISYLDMDNQGSSFLKTNKDPDADIVVVNTPGFIVPQLTDWIRQSDLIIIPTKTTGREIEPLKRTQTLVKANAPDTPIIYVLNMYNRWKVASEFKEWMSHQKRFENAVVLTIPQSEQIARASTLGKSVIELGKRTPAAKAILEFVNEVRKQTGFPSEKI